MMILQSNGQLSRSDLMIRFGRRGLLLLNSDFMTRVGTRYSKDEQKVDVSIYSRTDGDSYEELHVQINPMVEFIGSY